MQCCSHTCEVYDDGDRSESERKSTQTMLGAFHRDHTLYFFTISMQWSRTYLQFRTCGFGYSWNSIFLEYLLFCFSIFHPPFCNHSWRFFGVQLLFLLFFVIIFTDTDSLAFVLSHFILREGVLSLSTSEQRFLRFFFKIYFCQMASYLLSTTILRSVPSSLICWILPKWMSLKKIWLAPFPPPPW